MVPHSIWNRIDGMELFALPIQWLKTRQIVKYRKYWWNWWVIDIEMHRTFLRFQSASNILGIWCRITIIWSLFVAYLKSSLLIKRYFTYFAVWNADGSFSWLKLRYSLLKLEEFDGSCYTSSGSVNRQCNRSNSNKENNFNLFFTKNTEGEKSSSYHFIFCDNFYWKIPVTFLPPFSASVRISLYQNWIFNEDEQKNCNWRWYAMLVSIKHHGGTKKMLADIVSDCDELN